MLVLVYWIKWIFLYCFVLCFYIEMGPYHCVSEKLCSHIAFKMVLFFILIALAMN